MQIVLRRATAAHVPDYVRIDRKAESRTYLAITNVNEALKSIEMSVTYVIERNGQAVGFIGYEQKSPDHANIIQVVVDPDFQGKGIARKALMFIMKELKDVKRVDLETHPENQARHLYESCDFKVEGRIENYHDSGEPRLIMVRHA